MKFLIILGLIATVGGSTIGGYLTPVFDFLDFTAPVLKPENVHRTIETDQPFNFIIMFEEEESSVTCLFEKTSGPTFFSKNYDGAPPWPIAPTEWPITTKRTDADRCASDSLITGKEPGEAGFHITVTDGGGNVSTTTVSMTVKNRPPPRICEDGSGVVADMLGGKCCMDEQILIYPKGAPDYTKIVRKCDVKTARERRRS